MKELHTQGRQAEGYTDTVRHQQQPRRTSPGHRHEDDGLGRLRQVLQGQAGGHLLEVSTLTLLKSEVNGQEGCSWSPNVLSDSQCGTQL